MAQEDRYRLGRRSGSDALGRTGVVRAVILNAECREAKEQQQLQRG